MKRSLFPMLFGAFIFGCTSSLLAQVVTLPEIMIRAVNYKYLSATTGKEVAAPVKRLEQEAAIFDVKKADFYEDDYDNYTVTFYIPEGTILASYDKNGKLLRTAEKYKNVAIPTAVRQLVVKRYPQWTIAKDVYLVSYHDTHGVTKKYKLLLENGDKRMKVKVDEKGQLL